MRHLVLQVLFNRGISIITRLYLPRRHSHLGAFLLLTKSQNQSHNNNQNMSIKMNFSSKQAEEIFWSPAETFENSNRSKAPQVVAIENKKIAKPSYPARSLFAKFDRFKTNERGAGVTRHQPETKPTWWPIRRHRRCRRGAAKANPLDCTIMCPIEQVSRYGSISRTPPYGIGEKSFSDEDTRSLVRSFALKQLYNQPPVDKPVVYQNASIAFGGYVESCLLDGLVAQNAKYTPWGSEPVVMPDNECANLTS